MIHRKLFGLFIGVTELYLENMSSISNSLSVISNHSHLRSGRKPSNPYPEWREKVGLIIASNLQKMYRGWKVRQMLLFERWIEINHAASIIQKAFRSNRQKMENKYFIDAYLFAKNKKKLLAEFKLKQADNYNSKIERIFNNECTYEENVAFWRSIIELRRAYRQYSTDVLIKALIENKNDVLGAIKTLGNIQFSIRNEGNLSTENRLKFLPEPLKVDPNILFQSPRFQMSSNQNISRNGGRPGSTVKQRMQASPYGRHQPAAAASRSSTANGMNRTRQMTAQSYSSPGMTNGNSYESYVEELKWSKSSFQIDVLRVLIQAYFSTKQKQTKKEPK